MPDISSHKICSTCKDWKPRTCFYKESRVHDGLQAECNDCKAEYRKRYRASEHGKKWNQKWARERYRREDKSVLKARDAITKNVYRGKIQRPETCSKCGKAGYIEAHHHKGYAYEHRFDVVWLCSMCHNKLERESRESISTLPS